MSLQSAKHYYAKESWDVDSWVDVISVEYEQLIQRYPFEAVLRSLAGKKNALRLLDVGCGTGIFPSYLDKALSDGLLLSCDLLDLSRSSLEEAKRVFGALDHFRVNKLIEAFIEEIPAQLSPEAGTYDLIWAIHSFTTVDIGKMMAVYRHLLDLLRPGGYFFIYQLAAASTYQVLHQFYLRLHPNGRDKMPYMQFEDSQEILDALGTAYDVYELAFTHEVPGDSPAILEKYLRKCILDDDVEVLTLFSPLLERFYDEARGVYVFPQQVNFLAIHKPAAAHP